MLLFTEAAGSAVVLTSGQAAGGLGDGAHPVISFAGQGGVLLSPTHALLIEDVLVPAIALADGTGIRQVPATGGITYFHIALASHDVVLAEGAPAESFLDDGSHLLFANAASHVDRPGAALPCAHRVEDGHRLEAIRRRRARRSLPRREPGS